MARVVKVDLLLDVAKYLRPAREAKRETKGVAEALDDAAKSGDRTSTALDKTAAEMSDAARAAAALDRRVDELRESLRGLAVQSALGGGSADLDKQFRQQQAALRKALNARKVLGDAGEEGAEGFAARFVGRLGPLMASAPIGPGAAAAGAAMGAAMAPTLGAAVAAGVVGGAAGLGIVGGVIMAARDERVKAAGTALGAFILGDLEARSARFVAPVLEGIEDIRAAWYKMGPDLDRIFASSRFVDPLVTGALSGARKLIAGVADAVDQADPVVDALANSFDRIGETTGDVFSTLAQDADEGASAINDLTLALTSFIQATGAVVHAGATVKGWTDELDIAIDKGRYWLEDMKHYKGWLDITADGFEAGSKEAAAYREATLGTADAADFATLKTAGMTDAEIAAADASHTYRAATDETANALGRTGDKAAIATVQVESLDAAIKRMAGENISAEQAQIRLEEAIDRATAAGARNNDGIDRSTEKGRANRSLLVSLAEASNTTAEAIFKQTGSQELASAATERGRAAFLKSAAAMGVSKAEALRLANQLFAIPKKVDTKIMVTANTQPALDSARSIVARINNMHARINVSAEPSGGYGGSAHTGDGYSTGMRWGGAFEHARDGLIGLRDAGIYSPAGPARYAFAEPATGGEAFIPRFGNRDRSLDILATAARWYGMQVGPTARAAAPAQPAGHSPAHLAAAVRAALVGVSVQMDGRTVGVIQGRQADIYERGA